MPSRNADMAPGRRKRKQDRATGKAPPSGPKATNRAKRAAGAATRAAGAATRATGIGTARRNTGERLQNISVPMSRALPRTFQGRLSLAFVLVFALAVGIVSILTVFVLNNDLRQQETTNLEARANA